MPNTAEQRDAAGQQRGIVRTLSDVKVGDVVFVAYQVRRRESQRVARPETVARVGRKYGYLSTEFRDEKKFDLETGVSVHDKDCNARANGMGFDVYRSEDDYIIEQFNDNQRKRLQSRLVTSFGRIVDLPPDVVNELHGILDNAEVA